MDPFATGGDLLEGTQGADAQGGAPFSISSDGRWLSFALTVPLPPGFADNPSALAAFELDRLRHFRLFDLHGGVVVLPLVSPEAESLVLNGGHPLLGAGCWTGARLVLRTASNRQLFLDADQHPPRWRPESRREKQSRCPFPDRRSLKSGGYGPVRLIVGKGGPVVLSDRRSGRELAAHAPGWLPGMAVQVPYLEVSPDGKRVAYGILDHFGSFVGNTTAYVLNPADRTGAWALASPVPFILWAPDGRSLFGYVKTIEDGVNTYAIHVWRLTN